MQEQYLQLQQDLVTDPYELTAFSGIPRFTIRALLAKCLDYLATPLGSGGSTAESTKHFTLLTNGNALVAAARVAVENLDKESGPLRWKITHGTWPQSDFEDITRDTYNQLSPDFGGNSAQPNAVKGATQTTPDPPVIPPDQKD